MSGIQMWSILYILITASEFTFAGQERWDNLHLPTKHSPYFFNNNPQLKQPCNQDNLCPYKKFLDSTSCWGYEDWCKKDNQYHITQCPGSSQNWASSKEKQLRQFWITADFGIISEKRRNLRTICIPNRSGQSSLSCVDHSQLCLARDLYIDLRRAKLSERNDSLDENLFVTGASIGGRCDLNRDVLKTLGEHKSPLQSWYAEIENFSSYHDWTCDVTLDKKTFILKLDAVVNLFHHFCDFVNLYLAQHFVNSFSRDINILIWVTRSPQPIDLFDITWSAFTINPLLFLTDFDGKRICIKDAVFAFLPRMRFGLYYNMPLIPGCHGSGFIKAFNEYLLHRLSIEQHPPIRKKIRITLLSRDTAYRNILNEPELLQRLKNNSNYVVNHVVFNHKIPFRDQVSLSHNTDILIGMHGAGLTHLLFLPHWAVVIELYHCGDENCYLDLARLRGVKYMTWTKMSKMIKEDEGHHPTLGAHEKFTNYSFDVDEFERLVGEAEKHVRHHNEFRQHIRSVKNKTEL